MMKAEVFSQWRIVLGKQDPIRGMEPPSSLFGKRFDIFDCFSVCVQAM